MGRSESQGHNHRLERLLLVLPGVLLVTIFWLVPLGVIFIFSFYTNNPFGGYDPIFTFQNFRAIGIEPFYRKIFFDRTLVNAIVVTVACVLVGYPVAYRLARMPEKRAAKLLVIIVVPFLTATIFRVYGLVYLLGNKGFINSLLMSLGASPIKLIWNKAGVIIGFLNVLLPYMILTLYASIVQVDRSLEEAARMLGASGWKAFLYILLPLTKPGIATGCIFVFAIAIGTFEVPAILGGMREMAISMLIQQKVGLMNYPMASALAVALLVLVVAVFALMRRLLGGKIRL